MPWSPKAIRDAMLLLAVIVPGLMFGLGIGGFLLARMVGLGDIAMWIALALSTVGLIISVILTFKMGRTHQRPKESIPA
ncbi:MAG TPA: hypothetical protein VFF30_07435 [Nitrososphaerales archaeon]|nr:hypothetical protein [Nitrososphaerales archaeon]